MKIMIMLILVIIIIKVTIIIIPVQIYLEFFPPLSVIALRVTAAIVSNRYVQPRLRIKMTTPTY